MFRRLANVHALVTAILVCSTLFIANAVHAEANNDTTIVTKVYRLGDKAVYTEGKNLWNPAIMIELLKAKIGDDDTTTIASYPQNLCLVISTTSDKHDIVMKTIEELRQKN